jgi:hypothetical protein
MKRTLSSIFCLALFSTCAMAQTTNSTAAAEVKQADFDEKSGALKRTETFTDEYKLVDGVWFPASRRLVRAENGKVITRVTEFQNPRIQFNNEQAAR